MLSRVTRIYWTTWSYQIKVSFIENNSFTKSDVKLEIDTIPS